jgi:hypothetical protein
MGRRSSKLCPVAVGLLALVAHGCTKKPEGYRYALSDLRVDYQSWNCRDLADEADELKTALAVAMDQRSSEHVAHLKAQTVAVQNAKSFKKCGA